MSDVTKALVKLVEKSASEYNSWQQAQQLISRGADIKAQTRNGPMIHAVIAEERRQRPVLAQKADNCLRLIQVLQNAASDELKKQVLSASSYNLQEIRLLVYYKGSCYQSETFGPLGLLGELLKQEKISIRGEIVKFLIETDANVRKSLIIIDGDGKSCLSLAKANSKCSADVTNYIQQQADQFVNQIPFTQASIDSNEVITWIRSSVNLEAVDQNGNTVLSNAVRSNNLELVRALISAGSNTNHKNNEGSTPLEIAKAAVPKNPQLIAFLEEQRNNVELGKLIIREKANLNIEHVQHLLENGANINAALANGDSPLHLLVANEGTSDMIKAFVNDLNADISIANSRGHRPIETCVLCDKSPFPCLQVLLTLPKMTIDKFHNPLLNKTLLQFAYEQNRSGAAEFIQAELNLRLWSCIIKASTNEDNNKIIIDTAKQLIGCGAQINHLHTDSEYDQWTVLHVVTKQGTVAMLQYLIRHLKADYALRNGKGDSPICIAAELGHLHMVEYLSSLSQGYLNVKNKDKQTPLHLATKNNHFLVVRSLIKWGADNEAQDESKRTPLNIAEENLPKNKDEEINKKKIIKLLAGLICPAVDPKEEEAAVVQKKPSYDLDVCYLPKPVLLSSVTESTDDADALVGKKTKGLFTASPNEVLHEATKIGDILSAQKSIGEGADIRYRRGNQTAYEAAIAAHNEYMNKARVSVPVEAAHLRALATGCHQIAQMIQQMAYTKIKDAIQQSNAGLVIAYHRAGAPITNDLLYSACNTSDNVEIVHYLISQSKELQTGILNDFSPRSIYHIVRAKQFNRILMYLKYQFSINCATAVKENNFALVKNLVSIGASVDMENTNNLIEAIKHQNLEMIEFLCQHGAKMPAEWFSAKAVLLEPGISAKSRSNMMRILTRYLMERVLRFAAANGDLNNVVLCQRSGVDIDSTNCHGSTALLSTIQHGNYFPIVHALVSRGASILHKNENIQLSTIDMAKELNYNQIAQYLTNELNTQFLSAILNNDQQSAQKLAQLGADFNYKDEQERTVLHYAVQYYGIDLVTWLCQCGSVPTFSDINGDYPIMHAVEKGDYAVVQLFVTKYPATKKQTNKQGMTALQIAQKLKFNRIVQLIETGMGESDTRSDADGKNNKSTLNKQILTQAARNGDMKIIRQFINQRYESKEEKKQICQILIQTAKRASQYEVLDALEPYYKTELKTDIASDMHLGSNIVLSDLHKKILIGVLDSLSNLIARSSIQLDPTDPNTFAQFFVGLTDNAAERSQELQDIKSEQDINKLIQQEDIHNQKQLDQIQAQLEQLEKNKRSLEERIADTEEQLSEEKKIAAKQRKEFLKEKEIHQQQLATYECSIFLFQRQHEATLNRKKAIDFFKSNGNLILFYRTIENHLEALFHSYLAALGGYVKVEASTKFGKIDKVVNAIPAHIPIINLSTSVVKSVLSPFLSKLDERQQKKEWHNISTLGNIEELGRIASETAGLITLYYSEQIQSIDTQKIKGTNVFNDNVHWIKQIYNVRPEASTEMPVIIVAEYVTAWIIDGLKTNNNIDINRSIPLQLWLHVAKKDPTDLGKLNKLTDTIGISAGKQKIPIKNQYGNSLQIQLRYLIGCVSVIGNDGNLYQYYKPNDNTDQELNNLDNFGHVYLTPFASDQKTLQAIVEGRRLQIFNSNEHKNLTKKFEDVAEYTQAFIEQTQRTQTKSLVTQETAEQIADVLRQQNIFVDSNAFTRELRATKEQVETTVDDLKEHFEEKVIYYQKSIDEANEQFKIESEKNRLAVKTDNEQRYNQAIKQIIHTTDQITNDLQQLINTRFEQIQKQLKEETEQIMAVAQKANAQSLAAIEKAQKACDTSLLAVQNSQKAADSAEQLTKWSKQLNEEFQATMNKCEKVTKQTAFEQQQSCQKAISDIQTQARVNLERTKDAAHQSAQSSKDSAQNAKESLSAVQDLQKTFKEQLQNHKAEVKQMMADTKDILKQSEKAANEAKEAQKNARQVADMHTEAVDRANAMHNKVDKALKDLQQLTKKLPAS